MPILTIALQSLGEVKYVIFDKTGTITKGKPKVTDIISEINEQDFLKIAYSLEKSSEHPLAKAVVEKAKEGFEVENFLAIAGKGVEAEINGKKYYAGNIKLMKENNIETEKYNNKASKLLGIFL